MMGKIRNIFKNFRFSILTAVVAGALLIVLLLTGYSIYRIWYEPQKITVSALVGTSQIENGKQRVSLSKFEEGVLFPKGKLTIDDKSSVLIGFASGQTLKIEGPNQYEYISSSRFNDQQIFVLKEKLTGKSLILSTQYGTNSGSAAVLADSGETVSNVLGALEDKRMVENKNLVWEKFLFCINGKISENTDKQISEINYTKYVHECMKDLNIKNLDELR